MRAGGREEGHAAPCLTGFFSFSDLKKCPDLSHRLQCWLRQVGVSCCKPSLERAGGHSAGENFASRLALGLEPPRRAGGSPCGPGLRAAPSVAGTRSTALSSAGEDGAPPRAVRGRSLAAASEEAASRRRVLLPPPMPADHPGGTPPAFPEWDPHAGPPVNYEADVPRGLRRAEGPGGGGPDQAGVGSATGAWRPWRFSLAQHGEPRSGAGRLPYSLPTPPPAA